MERRIIRLPADTRPILSVVIHTEEEFDWGADFDRGATGVEHMRHMDRAQDLFDAHGVTPTYVVGYPIADQETGYAPLKGYADHGRALIGTHLHPWVCPPHEETPCPRNSYPGNLPADLEHAKLKALTERIEQSFGTRPTVYLAGRYGFGPHTGAALADLGYRVDVSPAPPIDFGADGGPDYSDYTSDPYWFGDGLLGLPGTGDYVGALSALGRRGLYRLATQPALRAARLPGILSRLRLLERLRLSPEDYDAPDLRRLTHALLARGIRIFVFSFHSPSVHPGYTPYVRTEEDLRRFLGKVRDYLGFFMQEIGGQSMTPLQVRDYLERL
jgi:hypothetical protein